MDLVNTVLVLRIHTLYKGEGYRMEATWCFKKLINAKI